MITLMTRPGPLGGDAGLPASPPGVTGLSTQEEVALVAADLRELSRRLDGFRERLGALEAVAQLAPGGSSRSTRASRSPKRSRSS